MKRILVFASGIALALGLGSAGAYFTSQVQVPDNLITAGAVRVTSEPTTSAISVDGLAPGTDVVRTLTVRNTGSLAANVVVTGVKKAGITEFYNALTCRVSGGGRVLYDGPMSELRTAPVALAPGQSAELSFAVGLPATAGNALAEDYVRLSLYVDAEQVHE
jgi:predicted ribosomally synthesized peptide with SipW-like signal peptide